MSTGTIVLEALTIVIFVFLTFFGYRKGFIASVINFFGYILSCIIAYIFSRSLADTVYQLFLRERLVSKVNGIIPEILVKVGGKFSLPKNYSPESLAKAVPEMFQSLFSGAVQSNKLENVSAESISELSAIVVDQVFYPTLIIVVQAIMFFLLFSALLVVVKMITKLVRGFRKLPIIGTADALIGAGIGFLEAFVIVMLLSSLCKTLFTVGLEFKFLTTEDVSNAALFSFFYERRFLEILNKLPKPDIHGIFTSFSIITPTK